MPNIKKELLECVKRSGSTLKWAGIRFFSRHSRHETDFILRIGFSKEEYKEFIRNIDIDYEYIELCECCFGDAGFRNGRTALKNSLPGDEVWEIYEESQSVYDKTRGREPQIERSAQ